MKIAIVGWGVEGQSAYNFFGSEHEYLIVNEHPRDDFPPESDNLKLRFLKDERPTGMVGNISDLSYLEGIENYDKIFYSPSSYKNLLKTFGEDESFWAKTTTVQHLFFENCKSKNIIGVTGTKGKGTTSSLIYEILKSAGKTVYMAGNIGVSVLDYVNKIEWQDWVVLELSSFQLHNFPYSPHIGVCLMVAPEHLDWHGDMEEYVESKANIFKHQTAEDYAVYFADNEYSTKIASYSPGKKIPYFKKPGAYVRADGKIAVGEEELQLIDKSEIKLLGEHNLQNVCAAITAVWPVVKDPAVITEVLTTFSGLEHRLEFVRDLDGVKYYDDSFGTTPETAIVAMKAFEQPKVMILGGSDKGVPFDDLAAAVTQNNVRHVILIGDTGPKIGNLLRSHSFNGEISTGLTSMPEIVATAKSAAKSGDIVLLSTGCASFGLFHDYKDRGNQFKVAVRALA